MEISNKLWIQPILTAKTYCTRFIKYLLPLLYERRSCPFDLEPENMAHLSGKQARNVGPATSIFKRYANVLLDYAECLFQLNGEGDQTAWGIINQIRNRAWGNLEVGKSEALTATYLPYYKSLAAYYIEKGNTDVVVPSSYPIPFNETTVNVPDAKTYYTQLKADKGFASAAWLVALGMERRKEFNTEWSLAPDLIRSGFIEDHINRNYPKGVGYPNTNPLVQSAWQTYRTFDLDLRKMDMPITTDDI